MTHSSPSRGARRASSLIGLLLLGLLAGPAAALASETSAGLDADVESYTIAGYEIWFGPNLGVFAGTGNGAAGQLTGWYSSIEHSGVISPTGNITGGWATLYRQDGARISGWFEGGTVELVDPGAGCTAETHLVEGQLYGITRSSAGTVAAVAAARGSFEATLVHHRTWLFGRCISYSASVNGTISLFP